MAEDNLQGALPAATLTKVYDSRESGRGSITRFTLTNTTAAVINYRFKLVRTGDADGLKQYRRYNEPLFEYSFEDLVCDKPLLIIKDTELWLYADAVGVTWNIDIE